MRGPVLGVAAFGPLPARAQEPPALDVAAAEQALTSSQIYRAPGAVAQFDDTVVRAALTPETRVILAPWVDNDHRREYRRATFDLEDWADEHQFKMIVVTGLTVRLLSAGTIKPSDLDGLRTRLAYSDVTDGMTLAAQNIRDGSTHADDEPSAHVPADPAEAATVTAALREDPRYVSPGAGAALADDDIPASLTPDLPVRVALLPPLPVGAPFPDLAAAVSREFPGELVVVMRGRWIEAVGPDQATVNSARNYTLGRAAKAFLMWGTPQDALVRFFLARLSELRDGAAFNRPAPEPVLAAELFHRYARPVFITLALLLGGGSLLWWGYRLRRNQLASASALRIERARTYAELATVAATLRKADAAASIDAADPTLLGEAAQRHATARTLIEQADTPGAVRTARGVAGEAQNLLARAMRDTT